VFGYRWTLSITFMKGVMIARQSDVSDERHISVAKMLTTGKAEVLLIYYHRARYLVVWDV